MVLYDVIDFTPTNLKIKNVDTQFATQSQNHAKSSSNVSTNTNISQKINGVNSIISENAKNDTYIPQMYAGDKIAKIQVGMSDSERTEILKNKSLTVAHYQGQADEVIKDNKISLESKKISIVQKALKKLPTLLATTVIAMLKILMLKFHIQIIVLRKAQQKLPIKRF